MERGGGEQRDADELASELRGNPESSRSRVAPPPSAALFLRRHLCNDSKKREIRTNWTQGRREWTDVLHSVVAQAACLQARGCMQRNAAAAAALHELATRDLMFPRRPTPALGDGLQALATWMPTFPTCQLRSVLFYFILFYVTVCFYFECPGLQTQKYLR